MTWLNMVKGIVSRNFQLEDLALGYTAPLLT